MTINPTEIELIQKQLYLLNHNQFAEKIGENFVDRGDLNHIVEKYIKEKFNSKLNFTSKKKDEIQNDPNYPTEYYLFENNSLYIKESIELKGYLWNSAMYKMTKIGKILFIEIENALHEPTAQVHQPDATNDNDKDKQTNPNKKNIIKSNQKRSYNRHNYLLQKRKFNKNQFFRQQRQR